MSGRQYDAIEGIPICDECGSYSLRSEETNWNGNYCPQCKTWVFCTKFDENHPIWIAWKKYHEEQAKITPFVDFSYKFKDFKKEYATSDNYKPTIKTF